MNKEPILEVCDATKATCSTKAGKIINKIALLAMLLMTVNVYSQEFQAKVTVNAQRINNTVDRKIFNTLQTQLTNFLNTRKWGTDVFKQTEKIECHFLLNLESVTDQSYYKGQLVIQCARPVFNSTYQAALVNFQDADLVFKYVEYQPVEFNDNRVQGSDPLVGNLTATFAFYANLIMGLHYDSFSPKGGDKFYQKAQNIVNNAPEGQGITGWRVFDGLRNRYWLGENLSNSRNNILHDVIYAYYRSGLDKMVENEKEARTNLLQCLNQLKAFNTENPNSMFVQFFTQTKAQELVGFFTKASPEEKKQAVGILSVLDATNSGMYNESLR